LNFISSIRRELLARRISTVLAKSSAAPLDTPNQRHAAFAVLRAARLVSVGNWLAHKAQVRLELLEKQLAKDIMAHAKGFGAAALASLFAEYTKQVASCFDWLKGELTDDMSELLAILHKHTISAGAEHFGVDGEIPSNNTTLPDVLGAPPSDHLDKVASDLLFRLKAETRKAVEAGCTAAETVQRLGLNQPAETVAANIQVGTETVKAAIGLDDALSAINIGIRLFDTTDNSLMKFIQAAVTELASDADAQSFDALSGQGVKMGWTWAGIADGRQCDFCAYMDGGKWDENKEPIGDSPELESEPPTHYGDRCSLLPCDLDSELPSGDFESYLAGFSGKEQEEAFGKSALTAYRKGEITPAALMGQQSHELPLDKFRAMEPRLELDVEKYRRMGAETGAAANRITEATREAANA